MTRFCPFDIIASHLEPSSREVPAVVAARLASPGSRHTDDVEERGELGDAINRETVAPQSSLHRDSEGGRTCAAAFSAPNSTSTETISSNAESRPAVVAAAFTPPGSGHTDDVEERGELGDAINRETVAPQSSLHRDSESGRTCAAAFSASNSTSAETRSRLAESGEEVVAAASTASIPTSATTNSDELDLDPHYEIPNPIEPVSSTSIPPQTRSTTSTYDYSDGVCWIGPKPDQIDWARLEQDKRDYERYLRETYPVTFDGIHLVPPDKQPLWWKYRKPRGLK